LKQDTAESAEFISNKLLIAEASLRKTTSTDLSQLREDMATALRRSEVQFQEELTTSVQQSSTELEEACAEHRSGLGRHEEGVEAKLLDVTSNLGDMQTKQARAHADMDKAVLNARSGLMTRMETIELKIGNLHL